MFVRTKPLYFTSRVHEVLFLSTETRESMNHQNESSWSSASWCEAEPAQREEGTRSVITSHTWSRDKDCAYSEGLLRLIHPVITEHLHLQHNTRQTAAHATQNAAFSTFISSPTLSWVGSHVAFYGARGDKKLFTSATFSVQTGLTQD